MASDFNQELYERVVQFIATTRREKKERIRPESRLLQDLGVDGLDGDDLLAAFRDEFGVDFTGFDLTRHFGPEAGFNPFVWIIYKLGEPEKLKRIPITVMDLYEAARTKRFPDLSMREAI